MYPKEVKNEIDKLPGVKESAVIGLPHPDLGEAVTTVIVPNVASTTNEAIIIESLAPTLARFKLPQKIIFLSELPRNTLGRVQKKSLRESYVKLYPRP